MTNLELVNFEDYLADIAILKKHKELLIKDSNNQGAIKREIVLDLNHIESKHEIISRPQSILKFSQKASEMGWRNLESMSKKAFDVCESDGALLNDCLVNIKKIQEFSDASNLSDEHKDAVYRELEYYKDQQITLVTFSKDFKTKFNEKVVLFNREIVNAKNVTSSVVAKVALPKKSTLFNGVDIFAPYLGVLLVMMAIIIIAKKIIFSKLKKRTILVFFNIQKVTKFRVRLFGEVTKKNISVLNSVGLKLSKLFKIKYSALYGELKVIFSTKKDFSKVELKMLGNEISFHSFYNGHTGEFSDAFKFIISDLEKEGHEIAITTQFSTDGKIESSSLMIYSPN